MSKKIKSLRTLKANLYENDFDALDDDALLYSSTKTKHLPANKRKDKEKPLPASPKSTEEQLVDTRNNIFGPPISKRVVPCKCNKCGHNITGQLVSVIFSPISNLMTPFISYHCEGCQHSGHRSVKEKALCPNEFERTYF